MPDVQNHVCMFITNAVTSVRKVAGDLGVAAMDLVNVNARVHKHLSPAVGRACCFDGALGLDLNSAE